MALEDRDPTHETDDETSDYYTVRNPEAARKNPEAMAINVAAGRMAPEVLGAQTSSAPNEIANTRGQQLGTLPQIKIPEETGAESFGKYLAAGIAGGLASGFAGRGGETSAKIIQGMTEQARQKRASDQVGAITSLMSHALMSGDPKTIASAVSQLGNLKGLEPEAMQAVQKQVISMGAQVGTQAQREQSAKAIMDNLPAEIKNSPEGKMMGNILSANIPEEDRKLFLTHALDRLLPKPMTATQQLAQNKMNLLQLSANREKLTPEQNALLDQQMTAVGLHPIPAEQVISSSQREKYQEAGIDLTGIRTQDELQAKGFPKLLAEHNAREKDKEFRKKLEERRADKQDFKDYVDMHTPTDSKALYVDKKTGEAQAYGSKYEAGQAVQKGEVVALNPKQADIRTGGENVLSHVKLMVPHMGAIFMAGGGKLENLTNATFERWGNNPDAIVVYDQLGHMVPQALNSALGAGMPSAGLRGVLGAKYAEPIAPVRTDNLITAVDKSLTLLALAEMREKSAGVPLNPEYAKYTRVLEAMKQGVFPGSIRTNNKTGEKQVWGVDGWQTTK